MKNKFLASTFIAATMISFSAQAGDNYIGLGASVSNLTDVDVSVDGFGKVGSVPYKTGYGLNGEIGTKLTPSLRGGLEYSFRQNKVDGGANSKHDIHAVMANLYYDIDTGTALSPYVGAGAGYGGLDDSADFYDGFAYQGTAGLNYRFAQDLVGYVAYKYFSIMNAKDTNIELDVASHNAEMGIRFEFGGDSNSSYSAAPAPMAYNSNEFTPAPPPEVTANAPANYNSSSMSAQPPRYVAMDSGATPPVLQSTPASQAAVQSTSAPVAQQTSYAAPATIPGVKESVYLPQYRADLQPVAPRAQNGWVLTEDPYLADYRAKRGY